VRWKILQQLHRLFPWEYVSERIFKIGLILPNLWPNTKCIVFLRHSVCTWITCLEVISDSEMATSHILIVSHNSVTSQNNIKQTWCRTQVHICKLQIIARQRTVLVMYALWTATCYDKYPANYTTINAKLGDNGLQMLQSVINHHDIQSRIIIIN